METFIIEKKEILSRIESQIAAHQSILSNSKNRSSNESSTSYSSSTSKSSIVNNATVNNTINNQTTIQQNQQHHQQHQQQSQQQYQQQQQQEQKVTSSQSADQQLVEALEIEISELKRKIMELKTNLSFSQTSQQIQQYQVIPVPLYCNKIEGSNRT